MKVCAKTVRRNTLLPAVLPMLLLGWAGAGLSKLGARPFLTVVPPDNVRSIGARVTVERDGPRLPVRVAVAGLGLMGDPAPEFTFGLGESGAVARVPVAWADGKETVIERPTLNTALHAR